jgi:serine/threonine protein kinase
MALKKIYMSGTISQAKIQAANKEASILRNLEHHGFVNLFYSFFDSESVTVKYIENGNQTLKKEVRLIFCILMEHAPKGDLLHLIEKHKKSKTFISEELIWKYSKQISNGLRYLHDR